MAYKRYVHKKGKRHGPYYYKNVRDHSGKVKTVYLGKVSARGKKPLEAAIVFLVVLLIIISALFFIQNRNLVLSQQAAEENKVPFELDQILVKVLVKEDEYIQKELRVMNIGEEDEPINVEAVGVSHLVNVIDNDFTIKPGQTKIVRINFTSYDRNANVEQSPGVYIGKIVAKTDSYQKEVPIIVEIESKNVLFDMNLNPIARDRSISQGSSATFEVKVFNLQSIESYNVGMEFFVKDINGNTIVSEKESVVVQTQASFFKTLKIPENLKIGNYIFVAQASLGKSVGTSSYLFDVEKKSEEGRFSRFLGFCRNDSLCLALSFIIVLLLFSIGAYAYFFFGALIYEKLFGAGIESRGKEIETQRAGKNVLIKSFVDFAGWISAQNERRLKSKLKYEKERIRIEKEKQGLQLDLEEKRRKIQEEKKKLEEKEKEERRIVEEERKKEEENKKQKAEEKRRPHNAGKRVIFNFLHNLGLVNTKGERKGLEEQKRLRERERLKLKLEYEKERISIEKEKQNIQFDLEKRRRSIQEERRKIEEKEKQEQRIREKEKQSQEESKIKEEKRTKQEEEIKRKTEQDKLKEAQRKKKIEIRKKLWKVTRKRIFNFFHDLGFVKTEEEKKKLEEQKRLWKQEKLRRKLDYEQEKVRIQKENLQLKEKERKASEEKKKLEEEPGIKEEKRTKQEELKVKDEQRNNKEVGEKGKIKRTEPEENKKPFHNFLHNLGLLKTEKEKQEEAKLRLEAQKQKETELKKKLEEAKKANEAFESCRKLIGKCKDLLDKKEIGKAEKTYSELIEIYSNLQESLKSKIFRDVNSLYKDLLSKKSSLKVEIQDRKQANKRKEENLWQEKRKETAGKGQSARAWQGTRKKTIEFLHSLGLFKTPEEKKEINRRKQEVQETRQKENERKEQEKKNILEQKRRLEESALKQKQDKRLLEERKRQGILERKKRYEEEKRKLIEEKKKQSEQEKKGQELSRRKKLEDIKLLEQHLNEKESRISEFNGKINAENKEIKLSEKEFFKLEKDLKSLKNEKNELLNSYSKSIESKSKLSKQLEDALSGWKKKYDAKITEKSQIAKDIGILYENEIKALENELKLLSGKEKAEREKWKKLEIKAKYKLKEKEKENQLQEQIKNLLEERKNIESRNASNIISKKQLLENQKDMDDRISQREEELQGLIKRIEGKRSLIARYENSIKAIADSSKSEKSELLEKKKELGGMTYLLSFLKFPAKPEIVPKKIDIIEKQPEKQKKVEAPLNASVGKAPEEKKDKLNLKNLFKKIQPKKIKEDHGDPIEKKSEYKKEKLSFKTLFGKMQLKKVKEEPRETKQEKVEKETNGKGKDELKTLEEEINRLGSSIFNKEKQKKNGFFDSFFKKKEDKPSYEKESEKEKDYAVESKEKPGISKVQKKNEEKEHSETAKKDTLAGDKALQRSFENLKAKSEETREQEKKPNFMASFLDRLKKNRLEQKKLVGIMEGKSRKFIKCHKLLLGAESLLYKNNVAAAKKAYLKARNIYTELEYDEKKDIYGELNQLYVKLSKF